MVRLTSVLILGITVYQANGFLLKWVQICIDEFLSNRQVLVKHCFNGQVDESPSSSNRHRLCMFWMVENK
jgi:hypothetical protein